MASFWLKCNKLTGFISRGSLSGVCIARSVPNFGPHKNFGPKGSWLPSDCGNREVSEGPLGAPTGQFFIRVWHTRQRQNIISAGFRRADLPSQLSGCMAHLEKAGQRRGLQADCGSRAEGLEQRPHCALTHQPNGWAQASQWSKVVSALQTKERVDAYEKLKVSSSSYSITTLPLRRTQKCK